MLFLPTVQLFRRTTPTTLYAGTVGHGAFKSINGGNTWSEINTGLMNHFVQALAVDPVTPTILYAGTNGGVFKSMNGGENWSEANISLTTPYIQALAIDPVTSSI